jgi:hypothetical protein
MEPTESSLPNNGNEESELVPQEQELSPAERFSDNLDRINAIIKDMLTDETTSATELQEAWAVREFGCKNFVNTLEPTPDNPNLRNRAQFDIMVDKAQIFEQIGDVIRYLEDLDDAEEFAIGSHLDDVAISIGEELDAKTKELGDSPRELILRLRGVIKLSNRAYLRELIAEGIDYEDLLGNIYGMIIDEDGDPDEIFTRLGITE